MEAYVVKDDGGNGETVLVVLTEDWRRAREIVKIAEAEVAEEVDEVLDRDGWGEVAERLRRLGHAVISGVCVRDHDPHD
jgi:hypothetical protein